MMILGWKKKTKEQPSGDLNDTDNTKEKSIKVTTDEDIKLV